MKNKMIIITVVLVVLAGAGGFFGGMKYQQGKALTRQILGQQFNGRAGGTNQTGRIRTGGQVVGSILSIDDKSITVKLPDGSSKIIFYSPATTVSQTTQAVISDLKVGQNVGVFGVANSDGSVTAQNIQLNPLLGRNLTTTPIPSQTQ